MICDDTRLALLVIDTHCHLTFPEFRGKTAEVLADAAAAGVTGCITISTTTSDCLDALAVAKSHERVWCTAGVHPLYADAESERAQRRAAGSMSAEEAGEPGHVWENLGRVARDPRCVAWGELGLDQHYSDPPPHVQHAVLDEQLAFIESCNHSDVERGGIGARSTAAVNGEREGLPIVIHCRKAFEALVPILKRTKLRPERFVFHCFTGSPADMKLLLDFGACVSFTGILTYPSAQEVRDAAKLAPMDRIMVETDAPFLPPVPHRGKMPCVPAWTVLTARMLAEVKGVSFEELHERVNGNTARFFGVR